MIYCKKINKQQNLYTHFLPKVHDHGKLSYFFLLYIEHVTLLHKKIIGIDPLKSKVMKLTYIGKTTFNINGMIVHSTLNNSFK
jgi:hypothetical protein